MTGRASARLFAALDPPEDVAARLTEWARSLALGQPGRGGLRVLEPGSLHLTLCFLGERPLAEVEPLIEALSRTAEGVPACELELRAPAWLPPRRPRALTVEAGDDTGRLGGLQRSLAEALWETIGEAPPGGRFRPHITVARGRREAARGALPPTPQLRFQISDLALYRSRLEPGGARYERLANTVLEET